MAWHGERLKEIRKARGMTQVDLAQRVSVNERMFPRYEKPANDPESSVPNADILARISKILAVSADFLLGLSDDPGSHYVTSDELTPDEERLILAIRSKKAGKAASEFAALLQHMG